MHVGSWSSSQCPAAGPSGVPQPIRRSGWDGFALDPYGTAAPLSLPDAPDRDRRCTAWTSRRCVGCSSTRRACTRCRAARSATSAMPSCCSTRSTPSRSGIAPRRSAGPPIPDGFDRRLGELLIIVHRRSSASRTSGRRRPTTRRPTSSPDWSRTGSVTSVAGPVMVLADPTRGARAGRGTQLPPGIRLERLHGLVGEPARRAAADIVSVLLDAFGVEFDRRGRDRGGDHGLARPRGLHLLPRPPRREPGGRRPAGDVRWRELPLVDRHGDVGARPRPGSRGHGRGQPRCGRRAAASGPTSACSTTTTSRGGSMTDVGFAQVGDACPDLLLIG